MAIAYVGVGSNVGDRVDFVRRAVAALDGSPHVRIERVSSLYETTPLGGPPQRSFVNLVVRVSTDLNPQGLLGTCRQIEQLMGREASAIRWGPRVADLDILLYGDEKVSDPDLEIPHPRLSQRRFALVPLLEVEPDATDPWGKRYADFSDEAEGEVELLEPY